MVERVLPVLDHLLAANYQTDQERVRAIGQALAHAVRGSGRATWIGVVERTDVGHGRFTVYLLEDPHTNGSTKPDDIDELLNTIHGILPSQAILDSICLGGNHSPEEAKRLLIDGPNSTLVWETQI